MRRYRAVPYYFGTWAVIMGAWLLLLAGLAVALALGGMYMFLSLILGIILVAGGFAARERSRTGERVPDTAAEALRQARRERARRAMYEVI